MALKLRPSGLGFGIDKDRPDYTVLTGEWEIGRIYQTRSRWCVIFRGPYLSALARLANATSSGRSSLHRLALQFPNFCANVRRHVRHLALVNPIQRDAMGSELEGFIGRDARQAGFVGAPGGHVGA
jgi:hypothetical protein